MYHQLYIYDPQNELENRLAFIPQLNEAVTWSLQEMLHAVHPFVRLFRTDAERLQAYPGLNLRIIFRNPDRRNNRTYNRPTANEIGGIMLDDGSATTHERDIVIERRGAPFPEWISYMHSSYMPMQYPLLFPQGDLGWHNAIPLSGPNAQQPVVANNDENEDTDDEERRVDRAGFVTLMRWFAWVTVEIGGHVIDNRWVVPYNPVLLKLFDAHINVEICTSPGGIKYLFKYCYKGSDRAQVAIAQDAEIQGDNGQVEIVDEIKRYLDARYITPHVACWRILYYPLHQESPTVV